MDATDGAMKAQECRSCGGGDDEHCVNERGSARRRVRTFRTHAPSISLPPRNDFLQKGETGDERGTEREKRGAREFQSDEDEERALGGA